MNEFLNYFKVELTPLLNTNLHDNMEMLAKQMGIYLHPSFTKPKIDIVFTEDDKNGLD